jgi:hypothetical protein
MTKPTDPRSPTQRKADNDNHGVQLNPNNAKFGGGRPSAPPPAPQPPKKK